MGKTRSDCSRLRSSKALLDDNFNRHCKSKNLLKKGLVMEGSLFLARVNDFATFSLPEDDADAVSARHT